jgi:hypothetical protein
MDDNELDTYVSRSIKNWAAAQPQPRQDKDALLKKAKAVPPEALEPAYFRSDALLHTEFSSHRLASYYTGEWLRGSFTVSLGWPVQLITLIQVAA